MWHSWAGRRGEGVGREAPADGRAVGGRPKWRQVDRPARGSSVPPAGLGDAPDLAGRGITRKPDSVESRCWQCRGPRSLTQPPGGRCPRPGHRGHHEQESGCLRSPFGADGRCGRGLQPGGACGETPGAVVARDGEHGRHGDGGRELPGLLPGGVWGALLTEGRAGRGEEPTPGPEVPLATPSCLGCLQHALCSMCRAVRAPQPPAQRTRAPQCLPLSPPGSGRAADPHTPAPSAFTARWGSHHLTRRL